MINNVDQTDAMSSLSNDSYLKLGASASLNRLNDVPPSNIGMDLDPIVPTAPSVTTSVDPHNTLIHQQLQRSKFMDPSEPSDSSSDVSNFENNDHQEPESEQENSVTDTFRFRAHVTSRNDNASRDSFVDFNRVGLEGLEEFQDYSKEEDILIKKISEKINYGSRLHEAPVQITNHVSKKTEQQIRKGIEQVRRLFDSKKTNNQSLRIRSKLNELKIGDEYTVQFKKAMIDNIIASSIPALTRTEFLALLKEIASFGEACITTKEAVEALLKYEQERQHQYSYNEWADYLKFISKNGLLIDREFSIPLNVMVKNEAEREDDLYAHHVRLIQLFIQKGADPYYFSGEEVPVLVYLCNAYLSSLKSGHNGRIKERQAQLKEMFSGSICIHAD